MHFSSSCMTITEPPLNASLGLYNSRFGNIGRADSLDGNYSCHFDEVEDNFISRQLNVILYFVFTDTCPIVLPKTPVQ